MSDGRSREVRDPLDLRRAVACRECGSHPRAPSHPGKHCWFVFDLDRGWESCAACGTVQKADDSNKPCKGVVTVKLRGARS